MCVWGTQEKKKGGRGAWGGQKKTGALTGRGKEIYQRHRKNRPEGGKVSSWY